MKLVKVSKWDCEEAGGIWEGRSIGEGDLIGEEGASILNLTDGGGFI